MAATPSLAPPAWRRILTIKQIVINQVFQQFLMTALMTRRQIMLFSVIRHLLKR